MAASLQTLVVSDLSQPSFFAGVMIVKNSEVCPVLGENFVTYVSKLVFYAQTTGTVI